MCESEAWQICGLLVRELLAHEKLCNVNLTTIFRSQNSRSTFSFSQRLKENSVNSSWKPASILLTLIKLESRVRGKINKLNYSGMKERLSCIKTEFPADATAYDVTVVVGSFPRWVNAFRHFKHQTTLFHSSPHETRENLNLFRSNSDESFPH